MTAAATGDLVTHHARYWEAAGQGDLLIKRCLSCAQYFSYPRPVCPLCAGRETEWKVASGAGQIYSFCLMRRKGDVSSVPAYVTLEEGPTIQTALDPRHADSYRIGQRVRLTFARTEEHEHTPFFRPEDVAASE